MLDLESSSNCETLDQIIGIVTFFVTFTIMFTIMDSRLAIHTSNCAEIRMSNSFDFATGRAFQLKSTFTRKVFYFRDIAVTTIENNIALVQSNHFSITNLQIDLLINIG